MSRQGLELSSLSDDESSSFGELTRRLEILLQTHSPKSKTCINLYVFIQKQINQSSTHLIYKSQQINSHRARGILGAIMSPGADKERDARPRQSNGTSGYPAPRDDDAAEDQGQESSSMSGRSYDEQDEDWFVQGRYLKIFARQGNDSDREIHQKEFILLDSKNTEGTGVRVDRIAGKKFTSGWTRKYVAVVGPSEDDSSDDKGHAAGMSDGKFSIAHPGATQIHLEAIGSDSRGLEDRYARLDHTYNIPFAKYKCKDLGILTRDQLSILRLKYIEYLATEWHLVKQARESLVKLSPAASLISSSASPSTAPSINEAGSGSRRKRGVS